MKCFSIINSEIRCIIFQIINKHKNISITPGEMRVPGIERPVDPVDQLEILRAIDHPPVVGVVRLGSHGADLVSIGLLVQERGHVLPVGR